jgi:RHS repeat-associated protein
MSTGDNIYFDNLDTTGGVLNANNIYQSGRANSDVILVESPKWKPTPEPMTGFDIPGLRAVMLQVAFSSPTMNRPKTVTTAEGTANILLAQAKATVVVDMPPAKPAAGADPQYTYDLNGNRLTMTDPTGTTYYEYDALNRLTKITNPNGEVITYTYDAVGRRTAMTYANGMTTSYTYDAAGRLLDLVYQLGATQVAAFSYTYDKVGNRTSMTDEYGGHNYVYDTLYRLTQATHPHYDPVGNRYPATNVYNAANQLLEDDTYIYSYDRNGNTISKTNKVTGEYTRYYWNAENQMIGMEKYAQAGDATPTSTVSYIYDGLGRRVAKNIDGVITKYIYDQEDILLETDDNDNILARYTHGPGIDEPISMERNGSNYYYVADGLGSIVKLVDAAGATVNNYVYDSFGNMLEKTEGVANPYTYTAREYDAESGLYYYRFRYYDTETGRFLSEDPLMSGPNAYAYVGNSPLNFVDPLGLKKCSFTDWFVNRYMDREVLDCEIRCWNKLTCGLGRYILPAALTLGGIAETGVGIHSFPVMFGDQVLRTQYLESFQLLMLRLSYWTSKIVVPTAIPALLSSGFELLARYGQTIVGLSERIFFHDVTISAAGWSAGTLIGCSISCLMDSHNW